MAGWVGSANLARTIFILYNHSIKNDSKLAGKTCARRITILMLYAPQIWERTLHLQQKHFV